MERANKFLTVAAAQGVELLEPSVLGEGGEAGVDFSTYISGIFSSLITVVAVLAVLMIVIGGMQYVMSFAVGGKEEGRKKIWGAVWGLILALASFLILRTINPALVDINLNIQRLPDSPAASSSYSLTATDRDGNTSSITLNSLEDCLRARESLIRTDPDRIVSECAGSTQQSGDMTDDARNARGVCARDGYIICQYARDPNPAGGENRCQSAGLSDKWEQTTNDACGNQPPGDDWACCGQKPENIASTFYLIGRKGGALCFEGPFGSQENCQGSIPSLSLDANSSSLCSPYEQFTQSDPNRGPLCSSVSDPALDDTNIATTTGTWNDWGYDPGIKRQLDDASPSLQSLLGCMKERMPNNNIGKISSISDSRFIGNLAGCNTSSSCTRSCAHSCGSCHYGGGLGGGKSMAVDFGDEANKGYIISAAEACGVSRTHIKDEGDHIHISTNDCPKL